jgi:signal transduction histidine kinase
MEYKSPGLKKAVVYLIGGALIFVIGLIDHSTGEEVSFSIFYLIPIVYVTWFGKRTFGYLFALLGAATWFYVDSLSAPQFSSPAIPYWNAVVRLGFFLIVVYLTGELNDYKLNLVRRIDERTKDLLNEIEDHKRSKDELMQKSELLRKLTGRIDRIKEEENTKIAREIHDELGQYLTAINLEINFLKKKYSRNEDLVKRSDELSEMVNETLKTVRKISSELRPRLLDQLGVFPAIESTLRDLQNRTGIKCRFDMEIETMQLPVNVSTAFYRIFQEAITNAARHSKATGINVRVFTNGSKMLHMTIKDNGTGFIPQENHNGFDKTLGIIGMKERALIVGGNLEIDSAPGKGTEIRLNIPVQN